MSDTVASFSCLGGYNLAGNDWCGSGRLYSPTPMCHTALRQEGWMTTSLLYLDPVHLLAPETLLHCPFFSLSLLNSAVPAT